MGQIAFKLGVAKSSVSNWVGDIRLSSSQKKRLSLKGHTVDAIEKRRIARLRNEKEKRDVILNSAKEDIANISDRELWLIGVMLYWAEGGKTQRMVRFSNGDPEMIKLMMKFFRQICEVPEDKFRGYIHIHSHLDHRKAEKYWANVANIPLKQFYKTYRKINISSKNKKDTLPYGVMDVYICDVKLFLRISGWTKGIYEVINK